MRIDITGFEDVVNNILTQLNKLNEKIIFYYYMEGKTSKKYKNVVDLDNGMILMSKKDMPVDNDDVEAEVEKYFPYYYKMTRLYAHLSAIMDLDKKSFPDSFENCGYAILYDEDNPSFYISDEMNTIDFSQYDLDDDTMNYFNQELKVLMKNANKLNTDFKKYGSNEVAFFTECDMNDYKYLEDKKEEPQEMDTEWVAYHDPKIEKELNDMMSKKLIDEINSSPATTKIISPVNLSDDSSFRNWANNPEEAKKILYDRNCMEKFEELQKLSDEMFHKIMNNNGK